MKLLARLTAGTDTTNRRIFRAVLVVGAFTVLAKLATAGKDLLVARSFGRSDALDAFLIAYLVPSFVMSLLAGALVVAFVPKFVEARQKQGLDAAQRLLSSTLFFATIFLVVVAILLALLAPFYLPYLGSHFSTPKLHLTRQLSYVLLPFILFGSGTMFVSGVLNAGERFALAAATPLITPLVILGFLELGPARWGPFSLAYGVSAGSLLEALVVAQALRSQDLRFVLKWRGLDSNLRGVFSQFAPMLGGTFLMCSTGLVDQAMAAMLSPGSVAALSYGNKVVAALIGIGSVAVSTAILPYFAKMAANQDWYGCQNTLKRYVLLVVAVTVPLTGCLMAFSRPLVRVLFQRGAFGPTDTELVSWVQTCYCIQIPFYICGQLFVRFLSSIQRNDMLMYIAGVNLFLDIALNLVLMKTLGIAGIALSTSVVYAVSFVLVTSSSVRFLARRTRWLSVSTKAEEAVECDTIGQ